MFGFRQDDDLIGFVKGLFGTFRRFFFRP